MSVSIYKTSDPNESARFYENPKKVAVGYGSFRVLEGYEAESSDRFTDLTSNKIKCVIPFHGSPYHLFYDSLGHFFRAVEKYPDATFIINKNMLKDTYQTFSPFIEDLIKSYNIEYIDVSEDTTKTILLDNFYYYGVQVPPIPEPTEIIYNNIKKYIKEEDAPATKKVYVSRNKTSNRRYSGEEVTNIFPDIDINGQKFAHQRFRIDDEEILEKFFIEHGFEIVYAEDFQSMEEQINYMNKVKTLVCITGSSFVNCLFMKNGGNLIEIVTPMTTFQNFNPGSTSQSWNESLHHYGAEISFHKGFYYTTINNKELKAEKVIDRIINNKSLMAIIDE